MLKSILFFIMGFTVGVLLNLIIKIANKIKLGLIYYERKEEYEKEMKELKKQLFNKNFNLSIDEEEYDKKE